MPIPFHDASLAVYAQSLPAVCATMDKAKAHFLETGTDPEAVVQFSLFPDMKAFDFQIRSVVHHSLGAIEGLRSGHFAPPPPSPPLTWDALRERVADASAQITAVTPDEIEALSHREVLFTAGGRQRLFTAAEFVLSFSAPNLHFHATTAYDILRLKGVPLGKLDYIGRLRGRDPQAA